MLKSYEAIYEGGKLRWIGERPAEKKMKVIVTVLEEQSSSTPEQIKKLLDQSRGCVQPSRSIEEIDKDIREMRAEWDREWDR